MNNNVVIAIILLVALGSIACGWLYSLRWRADVRRQILDSRAQSRRQKIGQEIRSHGYRGRIEREVRFRTEQGKRRPGSPRKPKPARKKPEGHRNQQNNRNREPQQRATTDEQGWNSDNATAPAESEVRNSSDNEWGNNNETTEQSTSHDYDTADHPPPKSEKRGDNSTSEWPEQQGSGSADQGESGGQPGGWAPSDGMEHTADNPLGLAIGADSNEQNQTGASEGANPEGNW